VPVVELLIYCQNKKAAVVTDEKTTVLVTVFGCHIHPYLAAVCQEVGAVCFGAAVCQLITDIAKYSVGRLRPHFLDVCKPNWSAFSCTNAFGNMKYLQDYVCTQTDRKLLKEARWASFSLYWLRQCCKNNNTYKGNDTVTWHRLLIKTNLIRDGSISFNCIVFLSNY